MENSDPHQALAPDRLHIFHGGIFPDHVWKQTKRHIEALGRQAVKQVDDQLVIPSYNATKFTIIATTGWMLFPDGVVSTILMQLCTYHLQTDQNMRTFRK